MSETKKIPTFSWLVRRAEALLRKDPAEYARLRVEGSDKLLRGCLVHMNLGDSGGKTCFRLLAPDKHEYAMVSGMQFQGEFYTRYRFHIKPSTYRKRMHKFLPISLPEGARCDTATLCIYHNADGSLSHEGSWIGGRPRRDGKPSLDTCLVVRDSSGELIKATPNTAKLRAAGQQEDSSTPMDVLHGFLPGSCGSKLDWYASMECPEVTHYETEYETKGTQVVGQTATALDAPLWDTKKMKLLAAKAHSTALRFTKKFPHMKIAMYPMAREPDLQVNHIYQRGPLAYDRFDQDTRPTVVMGRDINDNPIQYWLPMLVVYWVGSAAKVYPFAYDEIQHHMQLLRSIRIVIPPAGCGGLIPKKPGDKSVSDSWRPGYKANTWGFNRKVMGEKASQERAMHGLQCFVSRQPDKNLYHYRHSQKDGGLDLIHDWATDQGKVMVTETLEGESQWQQFNHIEPYACDPSQVFSHIEEKELLDSIPMC